jgi:hypothetical protein
MSLFFLYLTSDPRLKYTEIPERLSRSKSGKGLKKYKKYNHVCLCTSDLPVVAERRNSHPFRSYAALTSDLPLNRTEIPTFWWRYFSDRNPEKDSKNPD